VLLCNKYDVSKLKGVWVRGCPLLADTFVPLNTVYLNTTHAIPIHRTKHSEIRTNVFIALTFPSLINLTNTTSEPQTLTTRIMDWRETVKYGHTDYSHRVRTSMDPYDNQLNSHDRHRSSVLTSKIQCTNQLAPYKRTWDGLPVATELPPFTIIYRSWPYSDPVPSGISRHVW